MPGVKRRRGFSVMTIIRYVVFFLFILGITLPLTAERIDRYDVTLRVHSDGTLDVNETISYDFEGAWRHGIFRDIPKAIRPASSRQHKRKSHLTILGREVQPGLLTRTIDLGLGDFRVTMDGKPVRWIRQSIRSSRAGEMVRLRIGDPDRTLTGVHRYAIRYRVAKGVLPASDGSGDAIRWNAVGTGWNVPIRRAHIEVILPPKLSRNNVKVRSYAGRYGSTRSVRSPIRWIDSHRFVLEDEALFPHEGITVEVIYPEGLLGQSGKQNVAVPFSERLIESLPLPLAILYLFFLGKLARKGKDPRAYSRSVAVQYYPPEGLSLLQAGLLLDAYADRQDIAPAIVELAQKGYLTIEETDNGTVLRRIEDADESKLTEDQRALLDQILFPTGPTFVVSTTDRDRREVLSSALNDLNNTLYDWSVRAGYFKENPSKARWIFLAKAIGFVLPIVAMIFYVVSRQVGADTFFLLIFAGVFISVGIGALLKAWKSGSISQTIFSVLWLGVAVFVFSFLLEDDFGSWTNLLLYPPLWVLVLLVFGIAHFYRRVGPYTHKGAQIHNHLLGLKEFVTRVEKDRIRRFLEQDPHYLDRLLPYAILFGVTDAWRELYDEFQVPAPVWFVGDFDDLGDFAQDMGTAASPPPSDSGGFSGGGDFSGGGGGGGGGGSW